MQPNDRPPHLRPIPALLGQGRRHTLKVIGLTHCRANIHSAWGTLRHYIHGEVFQDLCCPHQRLTQEFDMEIIAQDMNATYAFTSTVVGMLLCFM